jgi:pyridoxamine 5'-phosphate oxidase
VTRVLEDEVERDPLAQFRRWYAEAVEAGVQLPEAMTLATATPDGAPSARMVLLKGVDERGFVFYTNYESRKGHELAENPRAALVFHWPQTPRRQVSVNGSVERLPAEESAEYFRTRPFGSRIGAWASRQSDVIAGRDGLERLFAELESEHSEGEVPRPPWWGGYVLRPETVEFWQNRSNRLHDRLRYRRSGDDWIIERLSP